MGAQALKLPGPQALLRRCRAARRCMTNTQGFADVPTASKPQSLPDVQIRPFSLTKKSARNGASLKLEAALALFHRHHTSDHAGVECCAAVVRRYMFMSAAG